MNFSTVFFWLLNYYFLLYNKYIHYVYKYNKIKGVKIINNENRRVNLYMIFISIKICEYIDLFILLGFLFNFLNYVIVVYTIIAFILLYNHNYKYNLVKLQLITQNGTINVLYSNVTLIEALKKSKDVQPNINMYFPSKDKIFLSVKLNGHEIKPLLFSYLYQSDNTLGNLLAYKNISYNIENKLNISYFDKSMKKTDINIKDYLDLNINNVFYI